uniref:P-type ATPase C-terminal domain-containing protein n=1 Tax=Branchiostoma floridae TaxID=7739 RepID=C3YBI9_BRAFL|eukprot:XP_002606336.1 hypothetical protein BRAFLDRAFT_67579 [Branchiostoma floridae]
MYFDASVEEFLVAIALCHTVHVHSNNSSANSTPVKANGMSLDSAASFEYQASSPDEKALIGLRTLVYCIKELNEEQYADIKSKMTEARNALQDREEKVNAVITYIEKDFHLLGATGVEDKLQDGVSDTIQALRLAGVKVWVLTGDKQETAVNISHSCTHFQRGMSELYLVQQKTMQQCAETIMQHLKRIQEDHVTTHALVVDGMSLAHILTDHRDMFMELCQNCTAVLCCRMSPLQKAEVVKLVKASPEHPVTLAIGDGANDCSMIQEAHVGVGIMGKEGRQANVAFISPQLLFQFYNGYSQTGEKIEMSRFTP